MLQIKSDSNRCIVLALVLMALGILLLAMTRAEFSRSYADSREPNREANGEMRTGEAVVLVDLVYPAGADGVLRDFSYGGILANKTRLFVRTPEWDGLIEDLKQWVMVNSSTAESLGEIVPPNNAGVRRFELDQFRASALAREYTARRVQMRLASLDESELLRSGYLSVQLAEKHGKIYVAQLPTGLRVGWGTSRYEQVKLQTDPEVAVVQEVDSGVDDAEDQERESRQVEVPLERETFGGYSVLMSNCARANGSFATQLDDRRRVMGIGSGLCSLRSGDWNTLLKGLGPNRKNFTQILRKAAHSFANDELRSVQRLSEAVGRNAPAGKRITVASLPAAQQQAVVKAVRAKLAVECVSDILTGLEVGGQTGVVVRGRSRMEGDTLQIGKRSFAIARGRVWWRD